MLADRTCSPAGSSLFASRAELHHNNITVIEVYSSTIDLTYAFKACRNRKVLSLTVIEVRVGCLAEELHRIKVIV